MVFHGIIVCTVYRALQCMSYNLVFSVCSLTSLRALAILVWTHPLDCQLYQCFVLLCHLLLLYNLLEWRTWTWLCTSGWYPLDHRSHKRVSLVLGPPWLARFFYCCPHPHCLCDIIRWASWSASVLAVPTRTGWLWLCCCEAIAETDDDWETDLSCV
jgi:hypothetical protein